jgi:hypothetical protein
MMDHDAFTLLMKRFDQVDKDNNEIKTALQTHVEADAVVHAVVARQSTYWGLLIWLGGPVLLGLVAWLQGLFSHKH